MDSQIISALIGAAVGAVSTGVLVLYRDARKERRELKSVATGLFWEIDGFYKQYIRNVCRALKEKNTAELSFEMKPLDFGIFTVFEATADKVGLFDEPELVQGIVGFYGTARVYLDTLSDYRRTMDQIQAGQHQQRNKAVTLLNQVKAAAESFVPLANNVCGMLAKRAKLDYTFDAP
jgi:hypothetical protein